MKCEWAEGPPMKTARRNHAAALYKSSWGSKIYACGGITASDTCDVFDGEEWNILSAKMVEPRYKASNAVVWEDKFIICGGGGDSATSDSCDAFDGTSWNLLGARMNTPRSNNPLLAVYAGHLMICGGNDSEGNGLDSCEYFDGTSWQFLPAAMPSTRSAGSGGVLNNKLHYCSGYGASENNCAVYDGIAWSSVPLPGSVKGGYSTATVVDDELWICGSCCDGNKCVVSSGDEFVESDAKLWHDVNEDAAMTVGPDGAIYVTGGDSGGDHGWREENWVQVCAPKTIAV